jgi:glycosyltransferase involved in cell wall biosynthesis
MRFLTALPVYNERKHVNGVLDEVLRYSPEVLVVDDGSSDGTSEVLAARNDVQKITHEHNQGYGAALRTAFQYAILHHNDVVVTIDCDGQHQPGHIPAFVKAIEERGADIISGSRYLAHFAGDSLPPVERRQVNEHVTAEINHRLGLKLTDAFCGFKAYRTTALAQLELSEPGYAMPLQLWVQAGRAGMKIEELPVPLIYLPNEKRSFGAVLDDAQTRIQYYHLVLDKEMAKSAAQMTAGNLSLNVGCCGEGAGRC